MLGVENKKIKMSTYKANEDLSTRQKQPKNKNENKTI